MKTMAIVARQLVRHRDHTPGPAEHRRSEAARQGRWSHPTYAARLAMPSPTSSWSTRCGTPRMRSSESASAGRRRPTARSCSSRCAWRTTPSPRRSMPGWMPASRRPPTSRASERSSTRSWSATSSARCLVPCATGPLELADDDLTAREREILRLVSDGLTNGQIARELWVTEQTVKFHLSNVYRKLGVSNRTQASRYAHMNGLMRRAGTTAGRRPRSPTGARAAGQAHTADAPAPPDLRVGTSAITGLGERDSRGLARPRPPGGTAGRRRPARHRSTELTRTFGSSTCAGRHLADGRVGRGTRAARAERGGQDRDAEDAHRAARPHLGHGARDGGRRRRSAALDQHADRLRASGRPHLLPAAVGAGEPRLLRAATRNAGPPARAGRRCGARAGRPRVAGGHPGRAPTRMACRSGCRWPGAAHQPLGSARGRGHARPRPPRGGGRQGAGRRARARRRRGALDHPAIWTRSAASPTGSRCCGKDGAVRRDRSTN